MLVIINKNYWEIKIFISTKIRNKLRTGLKTHDILKDAWNPSSLDIEIFILVKKNYIDFIMRIIPDNKYWVNVNFLLCNETCSFIYNMKTTEPRQFPDLEIFHIDNFWFSLVLLWKCNYRPRISSSKEQIKSFVITLLNQ